jgi:hypothetical protein
LGSDVFVARLDAVGASLVFSTLLGGAENDAAAALCVDASGSTTVAGYTASADFPTTAGVFDASFNGLPIDAFVARLSPSAASLDYSTYIGGAQEDRIYALALDPSGAVTVVGSTASTDFPVTAGAFDTSYNGGIRDAFVARLSPSASSLEYSTFLGGDDNDEAYDTAVHGEPSTRTTMAAGTTGSRRA